MRETKESGPVVHSNEICKLQLHFYHGVLHHDVLVASHVVKVYIHERNPQFLILFIVIDNHLIEIVVHEIDISVIIRDFFFGQDDLSLVLCFVHLIVIYNVSYLADVSLC